MPLGMYFSYHLVLLFKLYSGFWDSNFFPYIFTDFQPAGDDTPILSVIFPSTAATARKQQYSSGLDSTTDAAWSSTTIGDTHTSPAHIYNADLFDLAFKPMLTYIGI